MFVDLVFFFFKQKTAYEMRISDWSSDVCSSDLRIAPRVVALVLRRGLRRRYAQRGAQRVAGELVDIGRRGAIAVARRIGIEVVDPVHLAARAERDDALAAFERAQHPEIDRARDARGDPRRIGRFVRSEEHTSELQSLMRISY